MQHLENDMDELFQRAAENYPLQKGEGNWESIAKKITDKSEPAIVVNPLQNNFAKKLIALSLLLFICAISWFVFHNTQYVNTNDYGKNKLPGQLSVKIEKNDALKKANTNNTDDAITSTVTGVKNESHHDDLNMNEQYVSAALRETENEQASLHLVNSNLNSTKRIFNNSLIKQKSSLFEEDFNQRERNIIAENLNIGMDESSLQIQKANEELRDEKKVDDIIRHTEKKKKALSPSIKNKKGLYLGIVAGPDISKVQSGSFNHSGLNAGVVAGYRLNKKISLETGISWDKKYYTSDGKNFSMDKVGSTMPSGMVINTIASNSSFVEIPLKIKFDFYKKGSTGLFASGGISSYIITKEQNIYQVTLNGNDEKISGIYEKNNFRLPAVANISVGYEKNISKRLDLRIEPYLKIPLKGMGVGSLPVTSAGLQIGITGRLK